jgi:nitrogen fixation NifU-like protein
MTQASVQTHGSAALDPLFGWLDHPTVNASLTGLCGDQVEFYLDIRQGVIADLRYYSEGCDYLRSCAAAVARRAKGMAILDALAISPRAIIEAHEGLPEKGRHCAILAVSTLYRAIAAYLLDQQAIRERAGAG